MGVILFNFGEKDYQGPCLLLPRAPFPSFVTLAGLTRPALAPPVSEGDRVAQLILERILMADVEEVDDLDVTQRGEGSFGSTGNN